MLAVPSETSVLASIEAVVRRANVVAALTAMGAPREHAEVAARGACAHVGATAAFEELLREAVDRLA